jgi:hypothetical protein
VVTFLSRHLVGAPALAAIARAISREEKRQEVRAGTKLIPVLQAKVRAVSLAAASTAFVVAAPPALAWHAAWASYAVTPATCGERD